MFLKLSIKHHFVGQRVVIFFAKKCFMLKKMKFAQYHETKLTYFIAQSFSELWRPFSINAIVGSLCLLLSCNDNVLTDHGRNVWQPKKSRQRVFGEKNWKPRFFQEAIGISYQFPGILCLLCRPKAAWATEIAPAFNFSWPFCDFSTFLWPSVLRKKYFSKYNATFCKFRRLERASLWCKFFHLVKKLKNV